MFKETRNTLGLISFSNVDKYATTYYLEYVNELCAGVKKYYMSGHERFLIYILS